MPKKMTHEEMAAEVAKMVAKRRAHVLFTCGEEGIVALTFEVIDSEEGPYHLEFHNVFYAADLEETLQSNPYWPFWMKQRTIHGGFQEEDDPDIRRGPGAFMKDDGEIDRIEQHWSFFMASSLMKTLQCDVTYIASTRMHRKGSPVTIPYKAQ